MRRSKCNRYLALDLGAESGRAMLATLEEGRIHLEEIHRFPNEPVEILGTIYWDVPRLFLEVRRAIRLAAKRSSERGGQLDAIGVDTWGVDYALIGRRGELLGNPVHYRDPRTEGIVERVLERIPRETIFEETGLQFLSFNTLFQLATELERDPEVFARASKLLFLPDLFHYFLTGRLQTERTIASTSQLWNPRRGAWSNVLLDALPIPASLLPEVCEPGTVVGPLRPEITREAALDTPPDVVAGACHDTAAAIAAVPVESSAGADETWAYLSSGTWSLMGVELDRPLVTADVLRESFTNEGGVGGTTRLLRNLMGLWLLQESRRQWSREDETAGKGEDEEIDYEALTDLAAGAPPLRSIVAPDDPQFFAPGDMPARIREFCSRSGQPVPENRGAIARCVLESLALSYRENAARIRRITGKRVARLHIIGGGSKNRLLDQLTADALGVEVVAGPAEATALGNALMQALATGALESVDALRRVVRASTDTETFHPNVREAAAWDDAAERYRTLAER